MMFHGSGDLRRVGYNSRKGAVALNSWSAASNGLHPFCRNGAPT